MRPLRRFTLGLALLFFGLGPIGCASVGTGDPVVVKGEDVLVNSLTFYDTATDWHMANSTRESVALYKAFEAFRKEFPKVWGTAKAALAVYKASRTEDHKFEWTKALDKVQQLVTDIKAAWTPATPPARLRYGRPRFIPLEA